MPNIARCASALARVILSAAGFAIIATTADAVPAISPTGAARMEQEKADAREQALKMQSMRRPYEMPRALNACSRTETPLGADRGSDGLARQGLGRGPRRAPVRVTQA